MIKYNDVRFIIGLLFAFLMVNYSFKLIPWRFVLLLGAAVAAVSLYAKYDLDGKLSKSSGSKLKVEPCEAPSEINKKASDNEGYKKIDLEKTGSSSKLFHVDTQQVRVDGDDKNLMFGVVGMAAKPYRDNQILAYIYDLNEARIRKYDSFRYTGESRIQPFKGKHSWLQAEGISRKVMEEDEGSGPSVVVENNPRTEENRGGG